MDKPYVISHTGATVDGRVVGENWDKYGERYEQYHNTVDWVEA